MAPPHPDRPREQSFSTADVELLVSTKFSGLMSLLTRALDTTAAAATISVTQ
jgi:hypothetical protein